MDWIGWAIGIVGIIATILTSLLRSRKAAKSRKKRIESARGEVVRALYDELAKNNKELQSPMVRALLENKYRDLGIVSPADNELPYIVADLITALAVNPFITPERRECLIERVTTLKGRFQKRPSVLMEAVSEWEKVSIRRVTASIVSLTAWAMISGIVIILLATFLTVQFLHLQPVNLLESLWLVLITTIIIALLQFDVLKRKRDKISINVRKALEDTVLEGLSKSQTNVSLERNVVISSEGRVSHADLVAVSNGKRLPVEIKHGAVNYRTIEQLASNMRQLESKRGLLVTSSGIGERFKEAAAQKGVLILDDVTSEEDIIQGLKKTRLFE